MVATGQSINIKTKNVINKNYYNYITYLTAGSSSESGKIYKAYRVIIVTSEIYDDLIIETLTMGEEGGDIKIVDKREIDIDAFWHAFNLKGEIAGLKFVKWLSTDSFVLDAQDKKLLFSNIGSITPKISVYKGKL